MFPCMHLWSKLINSEMINFTPDLLSFTFLLFLHKVLRDLQETLEFEIFGPQKNAERKSTDADMEEGKKIIRFSLNIHLVKFLTLKELSDKMETIDDEVKSDNSERKDETLQDV